MQKTGSTTKYYYPQGETLASYSSVVSQIDVAETENIYKYFQDLGETKLSKLYYTALARERYEMYRTDNYFK